MIERSPTASQGFNAMIEGSVATSQGSEAVDKL